MHVSAARSAAAEGGPALDIGGIDHVAVTLDVAILATEDEEDEMYLRKPYTSHVLLRKVKQVLTMAEAS